MSDDTNFLKETIETLKENGKAPSDVLWCGIKATKWNCSDYTKVNECYFSWEEFEKESNFEYDKGLRVEVPCLVIVGKDFWLERHEYDGDEWWEYKTLPIKPEKKNELPLRTER